MVNMEQESQDVGSESASPGSWLKMWMISPHPTKPTESEMPPNLRLQSKWFPWMLQVKNHWLRTQDNSPGPHAVG